MDNEVTVVRIYLREADHCKRKTLMQEVLNILHDQQRVQSFGRVPWDRWVWRQWRGARLRHAAAER